MFIFALFFALLGIVLTWGPIVLTFVASWKTHEKAGLPGWSGILPYYNYYVRANLCGNKQRFWRVLIFIGISMGIAIVGTIIMAITAGLSAVGLAGAAENTSDLSAMSALAPVLTTLVIGGLVSLATCVTSVLAIVQLVKIDVDFVARFGKQPAFALGILFLPYVFYPILAWGKTTLDNKDEVIDVDGTPIN